MRKSARAFVQAVAPSHKATGRNLPKIWQAREPEPSTINEKTIADFTRVVEQTRILERNTEGQNDGKA